MIVLLPETESAQFFPAARTPNSAWARCRRTNYGDVIVDGTDPPIRTYGDERSHYNIVALLRVLPVRRLGLRRRRTPLLLLLYFNWRVRRRCLPSTKQTPRRTPRPTLRPAIKSSNPHYTKPRPTKSNKEIIEIEPNVDTFVDGNHRRRSCGNRENIHARANRRGSREVLLKFETSLN